MAGCNTMAVRSSRQLDIYLRRCRRARTHVFVVRISVFIHMLNFCGWSHKTILREKFYGMYVSLVARPLLRKERLGAYCLHMHKIL